MKASDSEERILPPPLFDVGAIWTVLWQRWMTVLGSLVTVVLASFLYVMLAKPSYTATASILIDPRDPRTTGIDTVLPGIGDDSAAIASQVFVIEARDLLMKVFESEDIETDDEFSNPGLLSVFDIGNAKTRDSIFKRFQRKVSVERAGLTYVIDVSFTSKSAEKAARIANAIVGLYRAGLAGEREAANSDVNLLLADKIGGLQKNVSDAEREVGDFKFKHRILDSIAGGTLQSQIDQLTEQLIAARGASDQAKDKYDQALAVGTRPDSFNRLSEILSSATTDKLREDYNKRSAALANNEAVYQARHPTIVRLRSELERTKDLMGVEARRMTRELKAKYDLAAQNVSTLQSKLGSLRQQARDADVAQVELRRLESKAQAARTVLDDFQKRAEETSQLRGLQLSEARVINSASPPVQPTWPKPLLLLPVSALLGLVGGCGIALMRGPVVRPEGDPTAPRRRAAAVEPGNVIGIPSLSRPGTMPADFGELRLPGHAATGGRASIRAIRRHFLQPGSETFSRDMLQLVRKIIQRLTEHPKPYVLLVSSIRHSSDTKLASAMIGIGLQQAGQEVLVVEFENERGSNGQVPRKSGPFIDGASGLQTMIYTMAAQARPSLENILADAGNFDFVLLTGPSVTEGNWDSSFFTEMDLALFAIRPTEDPIQIGRLLRQQLDGGQIDRSAMLVIAPDEEWQADHHVPHNIAQRVERARDRAVASRR